MLSQQSSHLFLKVVHHRIPAANRTPLGQNTVYPGIVCARWNLGNDLYIVGKGETECPFCPRQVAVIIAAAQPQTPTVRCKRSISPGRICAEHSGAGVKIPKAPSISPSIDEKARASITPFPVISGSAMRCPFASRASIRGKRSISSAVDAYSITIWEPCRAESRIARMRITASASLRSWRESPRRRAIILRRSACFPSASVSVVSDNITSAPGCPPH